MARERVRTKYGHGAGKGKSRWAPREEVKKSAKKGRRQERPKDIEDRKKGNE